MRKSLKGTTAFFSPEIAQGIMYGKEVDIWAYGVFAYELASGKGNLPFGGIGEAGMLDAILDPNKPAPPIQGDNWSEEFKEFVSLCLDKNRNTRSKISDVLAHPFLAGAENLKDSWVAEYQRIHTKNEDEGISWDDL